VTDLFSPLSLRGATLRNRIMVSPMCQYSAVDGHPQPWHLVHLGGLARGGAGLVMAEATAVVPEGRITPRDTGIWDDEHISSWAPISGFIHEMGALAGVQLAHAGIKACTWWPWAQERGTVPIDQGGWQTVGPGDAGYPGLADPRALTTEEVGGVVESFAAAAGRADAAGFDVVEVHAAHGYLLHQFLSPLANDRSDRYGGDLLGRSRLLQEVVVAVRRAWPADKPLLVRISATDWAEGGLTLADTVTVAGWLRDLGADLIDVSSGGASPGQRIPLGPGYQVPLAARIRHEAGVPTAAVGLITEPAQAQAVVAAGSADVVALGRALLREPQWPLRAAHELGADVSWPPQLRRARW
jgi:2,4-dienoyl-CoA reductase-like NADH-dependent reductase (Old Yellow Enzyme family)